MIGTWIYFQGILDSTLMEFFRLLYLLPVADPGGGAEGAMPSPPALWK